MDSGWVEGIGHYLGQGYVVSNVGPDIVFLYAGMVGHGSSSRKVGRKDGKLIVPAKQIGDKQLPELVLEAGMHGFWQVGNRRDVLYSSKLPEGATLLTAPEAFDEPDPATADQSPEPEAEEPANPPERDRRPDKEIAADLTARVAGWVRVKATPEQERREGDLGGGQTALAFWTEGPDGKRRYSAPDIAAPEGSFERELAELLTARKKLRERLRTIANEAGNTFMLVPLIEGTMRDRIYLATGADQWLWNEGGVVQTLCDYRKGDEFVDLRQMIQSGRAVRIAHNTVSGQPVAMLGFLVLGQVAFSGREGDPFKLVVPADLGEARTVHALVQHEQGTTVYGFTVSNRSAQAAMAAAVGEGVNPLDALYRRVVSYSGTSRPSYLVLPDKRVLHIPNVK
jgi:hypothetical protein